MTEQNEAVQLRSLVKSDGTLELSLVEVEMPSPGPNEVLIRVEASPINPSDLGLLFGGADMETAKESGTVYRPVVQATVPEAAMRGLAGRADSSLPVGNEGAGTVIAAGPEAATLIGRRVALFGGSMWADYRVADAGAGVELATSRRARRRCDPCVP